ncbi:transmembrane protease serine 9-like [Bolinopsis microptera]|uniref:transmembrane protease serine 9-like n=1 Tax=Bolinopsis microptera TaxID=2820187 RepID=UPI003079A82C
MFWLLLSVLSSVTEGDVHYVPKLMIADGQNPMDGSVVRIIIMKMEECGEPEDTVFCSNRELSDVRTTAAVICRSIMDAYYTTGDAVRKDMTSEGEEIVETIGYDFKCEGKENNLDQCEGERVVCHDRVVVKCSDPGLSGICKSSCGCMAPSLLSKVIGGQDASPGEFPWQVTLTTKSKSKFFNCGGTIIDSEHILTAAHCLHYPSWPNVPCKAQKSSPDDKWKQCYWLTEIEVYYGSHEFYTRIDDPQTASVEYIYIHKDYVRGNTALRHDIAILKLDTPLVLNPYVHPACLPRADFQLPPNRNVTVSGFGDTTKSGGVIPSVLQKASLNWLPIELCGPIMFGFLFNEHLCAGDTTGSVDACRGDSGGPLVYKDDQGISTVMGIVSFSYGCAQLNLYGVYTNVQLERDFIDSVRTQTLDPNTITLFCKTKNGKCKSVKT